MRCNPQSADQAAKLALQQPADRYNPFNLLLADDQAAYVLHPVDHTIRRATA